MKSRTFKLLCIAAILMVACSIGLGAAPKLPVVGISTGSSGTSWRNIMIDALDSVGKEYKAAGKIKDYKLVNNVTNGDAT
jgi:ribose transport system substrate-binding protein